jgi:Domain of unknown function (DUF4337)
MSKTVHEVAHKVTHDAAHEEPHEGKSGVKLIGLLISVLALLLAVSEMLGKSAQTNALGLNIEASDTWSFFQAKSIRQTSLRTSLETLKLQADPARSDVQKQILAWQANIDRWESEPSTNEGRKELMVKAKAIEAKRDGYLEQYHAYEFASLLIQLGMVLASVTLLTSVMFFAGGSVVLGGAGLVVMLGAYAKIHAILALLH